MRQARVPNLRGVVVVGVDEDGRAAKYGAREGDLIVGVASGRDIKDVGSAEELAAEAAKADFARGLRLQAIRDGMKGFLEVKEYEIPAAAPTYRCDVLILTVIQGPDKGRKFELPDHEPQLIGRSSEALPIDDNAMSRRHAELTPDDGLWWIRDLESQNGTYVNGVKLPSGRSCAPGTRSGRGRRCLCLGRRRRGTSILCGWLGRGGWIRRSIRPSRAFRISGGNDDSIILAEPEPRAAAVDHLRVIYLLTAMVTTRVMDREQLLQGVMDLVFAEFGPQRGCIMLSGGPGLPAVAEVVKYKEPPLDPDDAKIHVSRTILHHAIEKGEGVLCTNAMTDPRFASGDSVQRFEYSVGDLFADPVSGADVRVLYIDSSVANYTFTQEQLALMNAIGQHVGLALSNAELYQQKLQSERLAAIGETVATLSHAIKNILQGLRGGADVVEMGLNKNDLKIAKGGWVIQKRNLDRIISLTMNMLAFSRQRGVELELLRLAPIVEECAQVLEGQCSSRQVALIVDVDPEMPPVPLDAPLIHQAILNLLTNAVEAVEPGTGAVTVRAVYRPGSAASAAVAKLQGKMGDFDPYPKRPEAREAGKKHSRMRRLRFW